MVTQTRNGEDWHEAVRPNRAAPHEKGWYLLVTRRRLPSHHGVAIETSDRHVASHSP